MDSQSWPLLLLVGHLEERRSLMKAKLMYKTVNQLAPQRLCNIFQFSNNVTSYNLRGSSNGLFIPRPRTEFLKKKFYL